MFGDFNDILHNGEKIGGPSRNDSVFKPFNDMLRSSEMNELVSSGNSFTWSGKRHDLWIQSKLDRCSGISNGFSSSLCPIRSFWRKGVLTIGLS